MRQPTTAARFARAAQAMLGLIVAAAGVAAFDWRAGITTFGLGLILTSGYWRTAA